MSSDGLVISERENGSRRVVTVVSGPSMTQQSDKDACDINKVMTRYLKTGFIPQISEGGMYGDFSSVEDYHLQLIRVQDAQKDFMLLPAEVRKRFKHDPAELIDFLSKAENRQEAEELGLIPRSEPDGPVDDVNEDAEPVEEDEPS